MNNWMTGRNNVKNSVMGSRRIWINSLRATENRRRYDPDDMVTSSRRKGPGAREGDEHIFEVGTDIANRHALVNQSVGGITTVHEGMDCVTKDGCFADAQFCAEPSDELEALGPADFQTPCVVRGDVGPGLQLGGGADGQEPRQVQVA